MNIRRTGYIVLTAILVLPLAAKDKAVASKWTAVPLQVDGQATEWAPEEMTAEDSVKAKFAVKNTADVIYVYLAMEDPKFQSSVDQTGITVWINPEMKSKKVHGIRFYRKTVTPDQLIQQLENEGQSLTPERKTELKTRPQYQIFASDMVNKKGDPVPHPAGVGSGTFRMSQAGKTKAYEFYIPMGLLNDPGGEMKVDPAKPFKVGLEWGGMTEEMKRVRAAQLGDRSAQATGSGSSSTLTGESGTFREPGGSLTAMRGGPKQYSFWFDLTVALNQ